MIERIGNLKPDVYSMSDDAEKLERIRKPDTFVDTFGIKQTFVPPKKAVRELEEYYNEHGHLPGTEVSIPEPEKIVQPIKKLPGKKIAA